jgi:hypothetical protein
VPRQGSALSEGLVSSFVRVSAHDFQGWVAAGTGRWIESGNGPIFQKHYL